MPMQLRLVGWLRLVIWVFAVLIGISFIAAVLMLVAGPDALQRATGASVVMPDFSVWFAISQVVYLAFGVGCAALLFGDRDLGSLTVPAAWAIVAIQLIDAIRGLGSGRLGVPLLVPVFAIYAVALSRALHKQEVSRARGETRAT